MISTAYKFIFVHIPKTGGNSIQDALLPFSDDSKHVLPPHGDGADRFEVMGPATPTKHATLEGYFEALGEASSGYRVMTVYRDPLERALSMYYSPSRILRKGGGDTFDMDVFEKIVSKMKTAVSFLTVRDQAVTPDFLLRFDSLELDFQQASRTLGLPCLKLAMLNVSADTSGQRMWLRNDLDVIAIVRAKFADDYGFFSSLPAS
jgi:hypothetical protein